MIRARLKHLSIQPRMGRKTEADNFEPREFIVEFGASGYIVLYWQDNEIIYLLAIRHQRESGY